jgi:hypothetical protein
MKKINLSDYKKNRVDKLDSVTTGINLERKQLEFIQANNVNLSALVRDIIEALITEDIEKQSRDKE